MKRGRVYLLVSSLGCPLGWPPDVFGYLPPWRKVQRQTICSDSIQSRSAKYLLWKARASRSKRVRSFLICLFLFLEASLMLARTVHFYGAAFDLPRTFFLFLQHVFIRNIPNFFCCCTLLRAHFKKHIRCCFWDVFSQTQCSNCAEETWNGHVFDVDKPVINIIRDI